MAGTSPAINDDTEITMSSDCASALDAVAPGPAKPGLGLPLRPIFAADPAGIAEFVEQIEQEGIVDLADIRLVPAGVAGDLHMRVMAGKRADALREIALHDLHMIKV